MTRDEVILIGEGASRLLNDEAVAAAMNFLIEDFKSGWETSRPEDVAHREHCYRMRKCMEMIRQSLETLAANGLIEIKNAEQKQRDAAGQSAVH